MPEMTIEQCKYNKEQCRIYNIEPLKIMIEKLETKIDKIFDILNEMPEKMDERNAKLYAVKSVEEDVEKLKLQKDKSFSYWFDAIFKIVSSILVAYIAYEITR